MKGNWEIKALDESKIAGLCDSLGISKLLACTLVARRLEDPEEAQRFLTPSLERDWHDPLLIPGLKDVVDVLADAIARQRKTLIFGDFDADGITASAVMLLGLRALGLEASVFIPRRQDEGYGLSCAAVDRILGLPAPDGSPQEAALSYRPDLIVTVDCGVSGAYEVEYMRSLGLDVAVTDHHNPQKDVPSKIPVCNPRLDPNCPSWDLAGVGVALKVIQVLGEKLGKKDIWRGLIDLAAIGTIADRMPLRGENRALVARGIRMIQENPRPGIVSSLVYAGETLKEVNSVSLSYSLIPRINAAGRMADASMALDMIVSNDPVEAEGLAAALEDVNSRRREAEIELTDCAEEAINLQYRGGRVLVIGSEGWHEGVKGIVASRLASRYGVPTILFTIQDGVAHGSGRSVGNVDLFEAISTVSDLVDSFGGHKYAVGLTLQAERFDEFKTRLENYFSKLPEDEFVSAVPVDGVLTFDDLTMDQVASLARLEPFGEDNPEPVFAITNAFINRARAVGSKKNHLSFSITNGISDAAAIYFHCSETDEYSSFAAPVDLIFSAKIEEFRGITQIKLKVKDMVPSITGDGEDNADIADFLGRLYKAADLMKLSTPLPSHGYEKSELAGLEREESASWVLPTGEDDEFANYDINAELAIALTGSKFSLYPSQRQTLELLAQGKSVLSVMATGRGKSLVFYIHAARTALMDGTQSMFVYPLRSLINDQAFHLGQSFARIGLSAQILTGETPAADREKIYESWEEGEIDVILTTPEFLELHHDKIEKSGCLGFIAIDEAHHIAESSDRHRPSYRRLGFLKEAFPYVNILAVTATAPGPYADAIMETLGITEVVSDPTPRNNLRIDDRRSISDRATYLATLAARGEKMIVYVNSRQASIDIARTLRKRLPDMAMQIGYYNATLNREQRQQLEQFFREGKLTVVVATSAFGEGVNIPDVRHVVLYHIPFTAVAYNQMAGRCGRDGLPASIHLLFNEEDIALDRELIQRFCPTRNQLELLYKVTCQRNDVLGRPVAEDELLEACKIQKLGARMTIESVRSGMGVFTELGLADAVQGKTGRSYVMHRGAHKVDLKTSTRYREAVIELEHFDGFTKWLMKEKVSGLLGGINRPLLPRM